MLGPRWPRRMTMRTHLAVTLSCHYGMPRTTLAERRRPIPRTHPVGLWESVLGIAFPLVGSTWASSSPLWWACRPVSRCWTVARISSSVNPASTRVSFSPAVLLVSDHAVAVQRSTQLGDTGTSTRFAVSVPYPSVRPSMSFTIIKPDAKRGRSQPPSIGMGEVNPLWHPSSTKLLSRCPLIR